MLPLTFLKSDPHHVLEQDNVLTIIGLQDALRRGPELRVTVKGKNRELRIRHDLSPRRLDLRLAGGMINWMPARNG